MRAGKDEVDENAGASPDTRVIHSDRHLNSSSAVVAPIYQTSTFRGQSAEDFAMRAGEPRHPEFYTRYGNPTLNQTEAVLCSLEGAESALMSASGMGAVTASVLSFVHQGTHMVAQREHYGGTLNLLHDFLPRFGVEVTQVDQSDGSAFERAIQPNTKLILVESPSNPLMTLTNLRAVAEIAKARGIVTLADNTFATPLNQRPLECGIDLVFHSATKYLGGHSDLIAGAVLGKASLVEKVWSNHVVIGAALGPFDSWLLLRGLRTLPVRVRQHNESALALARFLEGQRAVKQVLYPGLSSHPQHQLACRQMSGFGGMLSLELRGGYEAANRLLSSLRLVTRAASLGGVESLAVHPASNFLHYMSLEESANLGIVPGLVRVSVGLEGQNDLISDFEQALAQVEGGTQA